jgi:hypothetical protein
MIPRTIWMFWDKIEIPIDIQNIIDHNKKVLTDWEIIILNNNTIHDYIKEFPKKYNSISRIQQKSDWIRLYLLKNYGGVWSDISIIYNDVSKINKLWEQSPNYDYTAFYKGEKLNGIYEIVENWFIMCEKNSKIISLYLNEYEKAIEEGFLSYKKRIIEEGTIINKNNNTHNHIYFIAYYCLQHVLQHLKQIPPMNLLNSFDSMFYLTKKCGWKYNTTCRRNQFKSKKYKLPYIKLTRIDRKHLKLK